MSIKDLTHDRVWEAYYGELGVNFMRDTQKRVNWVCEMVSGKRILDIGCSSGIAPILLGREGRVVVGVDSDAKAIEEALAHLAEESAATQKRVRFIEADFLAIEGLDNQKFDTVIMSEVLEHLVRPADFVAAAAEYLSPGGTLVVTVPFGINDFIDHKKTYYLTESYGLLATCFDVTHVALLGKWIGLVGTKSEIGHYKGTIETWSNDHVAALENAVFEIERALRDNLAVEERKFKDLTAKQKIIIDQTNKLKQTLVERDTALRDTQAQIESLRLEAAHAATTASEQEAGLRQALVERKTALCDAHEQLQSLQSEAEQIRKAAGDQEAAFTRALEEAKNAADKLDTNFKGMLGREQRYKERIAELEETARRLRNADSYARRAEREKINAEKRAEDVKRTLSFQLGYALIQATQSWRGLMQLPTAMIRVRREAKQRRHAKLLKSERLPPAEKQETVKQVRAVRQMAEAFKIGAPASRTRLRIAAVMDEFTFHSYDPECDLLQLHPDTCVQQLAEFTPDLLFIESAWKGLEGLWQTKISNNGPEINACLEWCKANNVPTLFWNKEDPVHFSTFIPLAQQVDYVFTTDIDCIPKYKQAIGHDRVYLLPFAAQPKTHNPIELFERKDAFNFAGSYYLRYPERQRDFAALIDTVKTFKPVDIYDRNFDNPHPHYTFPDAYKAMILGRLPFEEIDKAYKGYRYGINMNTIKQSQTMFARRVFELLASNTVVVSNFARGVRLLFGDLVVASDEATQLHRRLQDICNDDVAYRKLRLMGLRKVMMEHTYAHRLSYIRAKLSGEAYSPQLPAVAVLAVAHTAEEQASLITQFNRQTYSPRTLYLLQAYADSAPVIGADIHTFADALACRDALNGVLPATPLVALFVAGDHYGPEYLADLALASTYSPATAFGKVAFYQATGAACQLQQDGQQYHPAISLLARSAIVRSASITSGWIDGCLAQPATTTFQYPDMLATDEFQYCRDGAGLSPEVLHETLEDLPLTNQGTSFVHALAATAESLQANGGPSGTDDGLPQISAETLFKLIPKPASTQLQLSFKNGALQLQSTLPVDKHAYLYADKRFTRDDLNLVLNSQFRLEAESTIPELKTIFEFQDADGQKISHAMNGAIGGKHALAIPNHCTAIRFGLRVQGPGKATIQRLVLGNHGERPAAIAGQSPYLVLTKQYPAYDDLYRYGFLHSRVQAYKSSGLVVDVFRITNEAAQVYREFEGIDVASGDAQLLDATLKTGRYRHVLVHLLDESMWRVLERHLDKIQVTVWVHGAEIQSWHRREFEFERLSTEEVLRQKKLSDKRKKFWQSILQPPHPNLRLVFVSQYFFDEITQDLDIRLPASQVEVIHNYIDNILFSYVVKPVEQRKKLLSIRPYASRKYANDLTVEAILELSKKDFFTELEFCLIGDGDLFNEITSPLRKFSNVKLEQRFMTHSEIAEVHHEYGVFLTPTRMDAQGVSRDEAMSSGLVPITTGVAAIPEFVDASCGIVVDAEDYMAMSAAVEYLYRNPDEFSKLSKSAAQRARAQCGFEQTIGHELSLIKRRTV